MRSNNNLYMPLDCVSKRAYFVQISLVLFRFCAGPRLLALHLENGRSLEHIFLRPNIHSSAPDFEFRIENIL